MPLDNPTTTILQGGSLQAPKKERVHPILRVMATVGAAWVVLTLLLYGISAALSGDALVFAVGGSYKTAVMVGLNIVILGFAWASPLLLSGQNAVAHVRGRTRVYVILQTLFLLVLMVGFAIMTTRSLFGFFPFGISLALTPNLESIAVTKIVAFVGAVGVGSMAGMSALLRPFSNKIGIYTVAPEETGGIKRVA